MQRTRNLTHTYIKKDSIMLRQSSYIFAKVLMVISSALLHLLCLVLYALLQLYFYCVQFSSASLHLFICLASLHNFYFIFYLFAS